MNLSSLLSKTLYAILLAPLHLEQSKSIRSPSALSITPSTYQRTTSIIRLIDSAIPGFAERLSRKVYENNIFPWTPVDTKLIAAGSGTAVFKVSWESGHKVLRIYRKSLGKPLSGLLEITRHYQRNYETVLAWYGSVTGLVPPMDFLVLHGLTFAKPVAASLQPYVQGQKKDLFEDFSDSEILRLFETNKRLHEQFLFFSEQTIRQWNGQQMCFDFLGRENLMLINDKGNSCLCIVDVGIFRFDVVARKYPEKMSQIEQRIKRMIYLYECAQEI